MTTQYGYARVSTAEQNEAMQITALEKSGCTKIFCDIGVSGVQESRTEFNKLLEILKSGDTVRVWRLDRISRSLKHLISLNDGFAERGVYFESLTEKIDTSAAIGEFVFHILGAVAQLERQMIRERTLAGMAEAAAKGNMPGRPRKLSPEQISWAVDAIVFGGSSYAEIAAQFDICEMTARRNILPQLAG